MQGRDKTRGLTGNRPPHLDTVVSIITVCSAANPTRVRQAVCDSLLLRLSLLAAGAGAVVEQASTPTATAACNNKHPEYNVVANGSLEAASEGAGQGLLSN